MQCNPGCHVQQANEFNPNPVSCPLCCQVYLRRMRKYLGAHLVHLGGHVDAIVFSAGRALDACTGTQGWHATGTCTLFCILPAAAP